MRYLKRIIRLLGPMEWLLNIIPVQESITFIKSSEMSQCVEQFPRCTCTCPETIEQWKILLK